MRTHIRMHIDKNSGDFNEENFISCILENSEVNINTNKANDKNSSNLIDKNYSVLKTESKRKHQMDDDVKEHSE